MPPSLYWYDFETTGTDPIRDRPLQFAGIRTDLDLNEIAEPQNFLGRPGGDVIPQPEALLVTGLLMSEVLESGMNERTFCSKVLEQFSVPETCVLGFNTLRFDDEFTRQMLYRNFHDPYSREWRSGNSRWDVIDLFRTAYALRPDGFNWPTRDDGAPSFRLEDLARANGLSHEDAHDALADVRATIEVTRKLKTAQPRLYDFLFELRDKKAVLRQLYPLGKQAVVHVSSMYPALRGCTALVLPMCQHPTNNNAVIAFDLSQQPDALIESSVEELARLVFSRGVELEETGDDRVALKTIHVNRCPSVAPRNTLSENAAERLGIDIAACDRHFESLKGRAGLVEKIQDAFQSHRFEEIDDPDFQLYGGGFFSDADRGVMNEVTRTDVSGLSTFEGRFQDDRLDEMLFRLKARNEPSALSETERTRWAALCREKWQREDLLTDTKARTAKLLEGDQSNTVLKDLEEYLDRLDAGVIA